MPMVRSTPCVTNEFLKEHRKVAELQSNAAHQQKKFQSKIADQEKEFETKFVQQQKAIEALAAGLKEQVSKIQEVSDQLKLTKSTSQLVANTY